MQLVLSRALLALYLLVLIWLVLFKFSFNLSTALDHQTGLNLIPFAASSSINGGINFREIIYNCIFFIPLGLLLSVNFKKIEFKWKFSLIIVLSLVAEIVQYIFAIGASDITDLITNALGGFLGLVVYDLSKRFVNNKNLDRVIISIGIVLFLLFIANVIRLLLGHMR
jgi:glycopeptide antibiotics resistance protein